MSFWWYKEDESGKKILLSIDTAPVLILMLLLSSLLVAIIWPKLFPKRSTLSASASIDNNISKCPYDDIKNAREKYFEEQTKIARANGKVFRNGLRLELRTRNRIIVLTDNCTSTPEEAVRYSFEDYYSDIGYFLISYVLWEGGGFVLIDARSGEQTHLDERPVFSTDRKRFVAMSLDLIAHYNSNSIKIFKIEQAGLTLEYSVDLEDDNWGPSDPIWKDNQTIEFKKNVLTEPDAEYRSAPALLIKQNGNWTIEVPGMEQSERE